MRQPFHFILLATVLIALAVFLPPENEAGILGKAAADLQQDVNHAAQDLEGALHDVEQRLSGTDTQGLWNDPVSVPEGISVLIWQNDSLSYWSRSTPGAELVQRSNASHLVLPDGLSLHRASTAHPGLHILRSIWYAPPFENRYLRAVPGPGLSLPEGVQLYTDPGMGSPVLDGEGHAMARLDLDPDQLSGEPWLIPRWVLWLAALVLVLIGLYNACRIWCERWGTRTGIGLLIAVIIALRAWSLIATPLPGLASLTLFDPLLYATSRTLPSLGDLLVNAVLAVFLAASMNVRLQDRRNAGPRPWQALAAAALLLYLAGNIAMVLIGLINDSSVGLDLYHVQSFDRYSWVGLMSMALLVAAWLILAHATVRLFARELSVRQLIIGAVAIYALNTMVFHAIEIRDTVLMFWTLPLLVLLVFTVRERPRPTYGLLMLASTAVFAAHVLDRYTLKREERDRSVLAEHAAAYDDPVVQLLFRDMASRLREDARLAELWKMDSVACGAADLDRLLRQEYFTGYWDRYSIRLSLFRADSSLRCTTSPDAAIGYELLADQVPEGMPTVDDPISRASRPPGEDQLFIGVIHPLSPGAGPIVVELRSRLMPEGLGFPDLLLSGERPFERRLDRYTRARYEGGVLADRSGDHPYPLNWSREMLSPELRYTEGGYDHLAWGDPQGTLVVLGLERPRLLDRLTTFSYLFTFFTVLVALALIVQRILRRRRRTDLGLAAKLRLGILLFAGLGLLLFSWGARNLLDEQYDLRSAALLEERSRSVLVELKNKLQGERSLSADLTPYLDHLLAKLSNVFFTDLTLYSPNGDLLATSREQVFDAGLLGRQMDPAAYAALAVRQASSFRQEEHIGKAEFSTNYVPFRNEQGRVLAYLALPYFARQAELEQERAGIVVALVNLFVLLFVLSVVAAAFIANWTTRPLRMLEQGLERIALGGTNEPIHYSGDDELGSLVQVYNRKVAELRSSAELLARSERESAWREMAQQVAHEVKNPLTPMKLSLQHFERTWRPDAPDAAERLQRFTSGMVEQIDALSRIASEFSSFAQMPRAQETNMDLRTVVQAAADMFQGARNVELTVHLPLPLPVRADREHLLRVFNNLLKNALQAIPEELDGKVDVRGEISDGQAMISIQDNGSGIAAGDQERIFRPNFTTKNSGMGLGLAMVKRLVENAGGKVWFDASRPSGTTFFVTLPLQQ